MSLKKRDYDIPENAITSLDEFMKRFPFTCEEQRAIIIEQLESRGYIPRSSYPKMVRLNLSLPPETIRYISDLEKLYRLSSERGHPVRFGYKLPKMAS